MESLLRNAPNPLYAKKYTGYLRYGTAGFRTRADRLPHVLYRMGLLAVLRSKFKRNAAIGLVVTASHNLACDNGVKLVDPAGDMLDSSWETAATLLANADDDDDLLSVLRRILLDPILLPPDEFRISADATVLLGRDTRDSGPFLLDAAVAGVRAFGGTVRDFGILATPQLHYLVVCVNTDGAYGEPTLHGYYDKLSKAFLRASRNRLDDDDDDHCHRRRRYEPQLFLDAANGVGADAVRRFQDYFRRISAAAAADLLAIDLYNHGDGELNRMCGADYVKVEQTLPSNFPTIPYVRCASLDGDADRVVYFYLDQDQRFHLLDGDRIATLVARYLRRLLRRCRLSSSVRLGLVQTAYANGASTDYVANVLQIPVACVPTGVKHLHAKAKEFDVGVYFEANGHGTVLFEPTVVRAINDAAANLELSATERTAASALADTIDLVNQTVGDALSDVLLVETVLRSNDWSVVDWENCYRDLPNKQLKVTVGDRNLVTTTDAERRCVAPDGLQDEIDRLVSRYERGRAFVRPSGTEDVVRVYAECERAEDLDRFAADVALLVYQRADGVGPLP